MSIRLATHNDVQAISSLYTEFFAYNAVQQPEYYAAAKEDGRYPGGVIGSEKGDIIVAEVDQTVVGFVHVEEESTPSYPAVLPHKFAYIVDLFVKQQHRKNGIGRLLLEEAKGWAQTRNLEYIELMVLENNDGGRNFYEREHFTGVSRTMRLDV